MVIVFQRDGVITVNISHQPFLQAFYFLAVQSEANLHQGMAQYRPDGIPSLRSFYIPGSIETSRHGIRSSSALLWLFCCVLNCKSVFLDVLLFVMVLMFYFVQTDSSAVLIHDFWMLNAITDCIVGTYSCIWMCNRTVLL